MNSKLGGWVWWLIGVLASSFPLAASAQPLPSSEEEVRQAAAEFVDAFNDLDWRRFAASWDENATAFLPLAGEPHRIVGRFSIVSVFQDVFGGFPTRAAGPPYLSIDPRDVVVRMAGETAVVTFHLGDSPPFSRRTLVFTKNAEGWRIIHPHASDPPR